MIRIFHNPRCRKSRETLSILEDKGEMVTIIDYLDTPPSEKELSEIITMLGISPQELIRKGEAIYKENFKGRNLSDKEWIAAMVSNPKLIERPIVIKDGQAVIGRPPERVLEII
ncbi:MAG: arsenate reductase (glutaredoxin) [Marinoscillum sp.]